MWRFSLLALLLTSFAAFGVRGQTPLPVIEEVDWPPLRDHCRQLLRSLHKTGSPLPAKTIRELTALVDRKPNDPAVASAAVQKLLDAHCLIGVNINAESRVKAARGPAAVQLRQNRPTFVFVKVNNEGGVTHALRLYGPELIRDGERGAGAWLEAALVTEPPFASELTGRRLEYRLLRLVPVESGRREATFQFDVGQGTQDLGFRAEVPILFSIRKE